MLLCADDGWTMNQEVIFTLGSGRLSVEAHYRPPTIPGQRREEKETDGVNREG